MGFRRPADTTMSRTDTTFKNIFQEYKKANEGEVATWGRLSHSSGHSVERDLPAHDMENERQDKAMGHNWRDSTPTNPAVSLGINGDLGSAIMMLHGMTLLALNSILDERWGNPLAALLAVHPIWAGEEEDDYIAVVLDAKFCHMELCTGAQDKGLQFPNGYADDEEDVIYAYQIVEAAMEQVNKQRLQAASKPNKRARTKKSDAASGTLEIADETVATGESSRPKKKSMSSGGEREASRVKKSDGKLSLAAAILQANNLTSKTKPSEVEAMYKSLEEGLG